MAFAILSTMAVYFSTLQSSHRIVVLEDSKHFRDLLVKFLNQSGYQARAYADGLQGEAAFMGQEADLLITDVIMPGKYGTDVAVDLQRHFPRLKVILMTGQRHSESFDIKTTADYDGFVLLNKPFKLEELLLEVQSLIGVVEKG